MFGRAGVVGQGLGDISAVELEKGKEEAAIGVMEEEEEEVGLADMVSDEEEEEQQQQQQPTAKRARGERGWKGWREGGRLGGVKDDCWSSLCKPWGL